MRVVVVHVILIMREVLVGNMIASNINDTGRGTGQTVFQTFNHSLRAGKQLRRPSAAFVL